MSKYISLERVVEEIDNMFSDVPDGEKDAIKDIINRALEEGGGLKKIRTAMREEFQGAFVRAFEDPDIEAEENIVKLFSSPNLEELRLLIEYGPKGKEESRIFDTIIKGAKNRLLGP